MIEIQRGGKIGVLLYEYQRSIGELKHTLSTIQPEELTVVVDRETANRNCISIQSILSHVVYCGYMYCDYIQRHRGLQVDDYSKVLYTSTTEYANALDAMFSHTLNIFGDINESDMDEYDPAKKIQMYWGQLYDFEQLMEHAIVHILRHRRQIEKFLSKLRGTA